MKDQYNTVILQIIKYQEEIIGPLAWSQAQEVAGIEIKNQLILLNGNGKIILETLVNKYKTLFGQASVEACKDALRETQLSIASSDLPEILR